MGEEAGPLDNRNIALEDVDTLLTHTLSCNSTQTTCLGTGLTEIVAVEDFKEADEATALDLGLCEVEWATRTSEIKISSHFKTVDHSLEITLESHPTRFRS